MRIIFLLVCLLANGFLYAQELSSDELYKQAMENAKVAFDAEQYSTAVMFYKQAQGVKPEALLPRYKMEDIRTIYIANEMDTIALDQEVKPETKKKKKKEIEVEKVAMATLAQQQATDRMNVEAEQEKLELAELKIEAQTINVVEEFEEPEEDAIEDATHSLETGLNKIESNNVQQLKSNEPKKTPTIKGEIKAVEPVVIFEEPHTKEPTPVVVKEKKTPAKPKPTPKTLPKKEGMSPEEKAIWVEAEKIRLAEKYPDSKTIEEIEKPGKHITRVIMNIDARVTVYLKVVHGWGATYFFIDELGQELKSINEQYFNLKTNLKSYETKAQ